MSEKIKDHIEVFHDYDIYLDRRTIPVFGEIDLKMFEKTFKNLHILDKINKPINIIINSEGGCITQARGIYDAISGCQSHVTALVYGEACSAATIILQAADIRYSTPNAKLMIHVGSEHLSEDHPRNIDTQYQELRKDEKWMEDIYLSRIKQIKKRFTRHQLKSLLQFDKFLEPEKAKEFGLIEDIRKSL